MHASTARSVVCCIYLGLRGDGQCVHACRLAAQAYVRRPRCPDRNQCGQWKIGRALPKRGKNGLLDDNVSIEVMFEERWVQVVNGSFSDGFEEYGAHVYRL